VRRKVKRLSGLMLELGQESEISDAVLSLRHHPENT
jgi:exodeoxyribonuclease V alpha subunit